MKYKKNIAGFILLFLLSSISSGYGADWCVQISSSRNLKILKQDFHKIKNYKNARIEKINDFYCLRFGRYDSADQAKKALQSVKHKFPLALVKKSSVETSGRITPQSSQMAKASVTSSETVASATPSLKNVPASHLISIQQSVKQINQTASTGKPQTAVEPEADDASHAEKVVATSSAQAKNTVQESKPLPMSLAEAVALNLRRNVSIKLAYMDRVQQKYDFITGYYYAYQPRISTNLSGGFSSSETKDNLTGVVTKTDSRTGGAGVTADITLPTGTSFSFIQPSPQWYETKSTTKTNGVEAPETMTRAKTWGVSFVQPLLKGAGID
jgi:hypothetical protein